MRIPAFLRPKKTADAAVWAVLAAAVLVWVVLLLQNLGYLSLWMDEGFHYLAAEGSLKHGYPLFPSGHVYFKAILYTYVLAFLSLLFGLGAETLRVVSVLCTAGLVLLIYHAGRRFFDRTVGILGAAVFAFSVWGVEYARLALYFAPLELFYFLGLYFFYRGFFDEVRAFKVWATVFFLLTPQVHQLGQGVVFAYAALFLIRGARRFFKKDVLWSAALVGLASLGLQLHEYFFWKVGYVYFKDDQSLGGMVRYFFGQFSLDYFKEFFRSFPRMSLAVLAGVFLCLGAFLRRREPSPDEAAASGPGPSASGSTPWLYLNLCFVFPLFFFAFFRTHVQPRYLAQLYPVFILLFLASLQAFARTFVGGLVLPALGIRRTKAAAGVTVLAFLGLVAGLVEGAGPGRLRSIVERRYGDPVTADIITRSGRFEHYDHRGAGEYARHFLREDDLVVAIHVVFQKIYTGRVDYWLWSGGPGTWDAWEKTADGTWRDFYVGARWVNDLEGLKRVVEGNPGRRVWLVGSPSLLRRDHINQAIYDYVAVENADKLVFRGKDAMSAVYLWNDPAFVAGPRRAVEGEGLPARWAEVEFGEAMSKGAAATWSGRQKRDDLFEAKAGGPLAAGTYRCLVRWKSDPTGSGPASLAVVDGRGERLRSVALAAEGPASGAWREDSFAFVLKAEGPVHLRFAVPARSRLSVDWVDLLPEEVSR